MTTTTIGKARTRRRRRKKSEENMEISSSIAKTLKRFAIPRSASSIDSFTTAKTPANSVLLPTEDNEKDSTPSSSHSQSSSSVTHKHPPLSYNQHVRARAARPYSEGNFPLDVIQLAADEPEAHPSKVSKDHRRTAGFMARERTYMTFPSSNSDPSIVTLSDECTREKVVDAT